MGTALCPGSEVAQLADWVALIEQLSQVSLKLTSNTWKLLKKIIHGKTFIQKLVDYYKIPQFNLFTKDCQSIVILVFLNLNLWLKWPQPLFPKKYHFKTNKVNRAQSYRAADQALSSAEQRA